jgi:DNA-binding GntR family transcriptional regulator
MKSLADPLPPNRAPASAAAWGQSTALAAAQLRDLIAQGELKPGERLPERLLRERLGLSRTPLREAIKILSAEGLLTLVPNRGAVVTSLSLTEVDDILQVLVGLEALAAPAACARITAEELATIERMHARMIEHHLRGELLEYFHVNQRIHQAIIDAAGNHALSRLYLAESRRIGRYRYAGNLQYERWEQAVREHELIFATLRARDGALLRELLRVHLEGGWHIVKETLAAELSHEPARIVQTRRTRRA